MAKTYVPIRLEPELIEKLEKRGPRSTVIERDLDRLYSLYDRALRRVNLTVEEACLIVDALNGTMHDVRSAIHFWMGVEDAIKLNGIDRDWGVDGKALVEKLSALDELACMAIVDAAERFWHSAQQKSENIDIRQAVAEAFGIKV